MKTYNLNKAVHSHQHIAGSGDQYAINSGETPPELKELVRMAHDLATKGRNLGRRNVIVGFKDEDGLEIKALHRPNTTDNGTSTQVKLAFNGTTYLDAYIRQPDGVTRKFGNMTVKAGDVWQLMLDSAHEKMFGPAAPRQKTALEQTLEQHEKTLAALRAPITAPAAPAVTAQRGQPSSPAVA